MSNRVDFENLRRVIELGATDAARDAGLTTFAIVVTIEPALALLPQGPEIVPAIKVEIAELTAEQAAELARRQPS